MIAHIVLFDPKTDASASTIRLFAQLLGRAGYEIPSIRRAYVGRSVDINPGYKRDFGDTAYSFAAVLEFDDQEGLMSYLKHPVHGELGALFWQLCSRTTIIEVQTMALADPGIEEFLVERPT